MIEALRRHGIATCGTMEPAAVDRLVAQVSRAQLYRSHVAAKAKEPSVIGTEEAHRLGWEAFSPEMWEVIAAPHWFEMALAFFPVAREYFGGELPRLYSVNAFWTCPSEVPYDTQDWHRDQDDRKQLVAFMLGTHVGRPGDGEHLYQRGTHLIASDDLLGRPHREPPEEIVERVGGPAGTVWLEDTWGIHVGLPPRAAPRLLFWARWGVSDPPQSYVWDELRPAPKALLGWRYPADPELQEAIKLVVR
jgi:hypothetical protein